MKDETSIFGAKPERLDRLVFEALQDSGAEEAVPTASLEAVLERPGGQIGRYKLLSVLGEGGMGIVCLAEQERPIKRRVAMKVIKPGMDSKRVISRFEAERQALALLAHPNIAHVHDAGTTEAGRPYFVMEYVQGLSITEYCDRHKLTIEDRLNLFRQICLAVHHAHQKGIIHRDIKPSNILVSTQDDKAVPKIIDFGVAKAISQPLTGRTLLTEDSQLLGTPEYMSPEQADLAGEDIDTRSDIYSLGVLLYVLLTGVLPFDSDTLREGGLDHIRKVIRETDPKTPSTRLSSLGEEAKKVAQSRRTEIAALAKKLHKELEWIPLKAMRKDRSERYRSASELSDDIENYLKGVPLMAGPPTNVYRLKKFVRRNRALVTGIAAVLAVLLGGVIVSTLFALGQARARAETQRQAKISEAVSTFLRDDLLASVDPARGRGRDVTIRSFLDTASENLDG
ncbi:MAG: serine/threonine protein kinase, partial [Planctomycetota bacterium]